MRLFAGDVGGTNCRMAVFESQGESLHEIWSKTYSSRAHASLNDVVRSAVEEARAALGEQARAALGEQARAALGGEARAVLDSDSRAVLDSGERARSSPSFVEAASFGIAGPVQGGVSRATNLPWIVDSRDLARELGLASAGLVNDLEANAYGLPALSEKDFATLHAGAPNVRGNAALISAGTGLGEAGLYWDGRELRPFACEGGHASFAPRVSDGDAIELDLLRWLAERYGHVSWERVASGPGLVNIYHFLRDTGRASEPADLAQRIARGDAGAEITHAAMNGECDLAVQALTLFVKLYGAEAGNLALKIMATGGVYIGGGIAPKIASWLARPNFIEAFLDKGRMRPLLEAMPVRIVLNDRTALIGAARHARLFARDVTAPASRDVRPNDGPRESA